MTSYACGTVISGQLHLHSTCVLNAVKSPDSNKLSKSCALYSFLSSVGYKRLIGQLASLNDNVKP